MIYAFFLFVFVQKSFLTKKYFLYVEINLTTRGPLYTCLVLLYILHQERAVRALEQHEFSFDAQSAEEATNEPATAAVDRDDAEPQRQTTDDHKLVHTVERTLLT